jgi:hypothetical protein
VNLLDPLQVDHWHDANLEIAMAGIVHRFGHDRAKQAFIEQRSVSSANGAQGVKVPAGAPNRSASSSS